jgi:hypothetical protein
MGNQRLKESKAKSIFLVYVSDIEMCTHINRFPWYTGSMHANKIYI